MIVRTVGDLRRALKGVPDDVRLSVEGSDYDPVMCMAASAALLTYPDDPSNIHTQRWRLQLPIFEITGVVGDNGENNWERLVTADGCKAGIHHTITGVYYHCVDCGQILPNCIPQIVKQDTYTAYHHCLVHTFHMPNVLYHTPGYIEWAIRKAKGLKVDPWPHIEGKVK